MLRLSSILVSVLTALVVAYGSFASAQGTVIDDLGRRVRTVRPPARIVTMIPTHTETVCALGACDRIVGVDAFSNHPVEVTALPSLGSAFEADIEALLALEPDLVLTDEYSGLHDALAPFGIPVFAGTPQTVTEVWTLTRAIGVLIGAPAQAETLIADALDAIDVLAREVAGSTYPKVYVELDASPYSVTTAGYLGELLRLAGGDNIAPPSLGAFPLVDPELIVATNPDVMLLLDAPYGESAATVAARPGWGGLDAVRAGAIVEFTQEQVDLLNRAGPRLPDALALLVATLREYRD